MQKPVNVQKIDYRGWKDSVEITNDWVRVVIVPAIGRIMHYGFSDAENILYEVPEFYGKTLQGSEPLQENGEPIWASFGGDRIWPSEENMFVVINGHKRPPDHWLDGMNWHAELLTDGVRITSMVSDYCGASVTREIRLSPDSTRVVINQRMEKIKQGRKQELEPLPLTIWNITKIKPPSQTLVSLNKDSCFEGRMLVPFWDDYDNQGAGNCSIEGDVGIFIPDPVRNQKMGADATNWVAGIIGQTVMAEFFPYQRDAVYPDGGTSATVFTCPTFTELECLSPLKRLEVGESMEYQIVWELFELPSNLKGPEQKRQKAVQWLDSNI